MLFMSSSFEKLDFIVEKIDDIESFKARYKSIEDLLNDVMGYDATLMSLLQIGETLNKLRDESFAEKLPIKGTYDVRNFIRTQLPKLKQIILDIKN